MVARPSRSGRQQVKQGRSSCTIQPPRCSASSLPAQQGKCGADLCLCIPRSDQTRMVWLNKLDPLAGGGWLRAVGEVGFGAGLVDVRPADGGEVRADGDVGAPRGCAAREVVPRDGGSLWVVGGWQQGDEAGK